MKRVWVVDVKGYGTFGCETEEIAQVAVKELMKYGEHQVTYFSVEVYENANAIVREALHIKQMEET